MLSVMLRFGMLADPSVVKQVFRLILTRLQNSRWYQFARSYKDFYNLA